MPFYLITNGNQYGDLSVLTPLHFPSVHDTPMDLSTTRLTRLHLPSTLETALDLSTSGPSAIHLPSVHEAAIDLSTSGLTTIHKGLSVDEDYDYL